MYYSKNNIPLKRYKNDFDFDIILLLAIGMVTGILFRIVLGKFVHPSLMIPVFAMIVFVTIIMILPSKINKGRKIVEQYFCFYKSEAIKIKERVMKL